MELCQDDIDLGYQFVTWEEVAPSASSAASSTSLFANRGRPEQGQDDEDV